MNIECGFSHNLDMAGAGLLHTRFGMFGLSLVSLPRRAAGSAPPPLVNSKYTALALCI
jgi:hypothetical protein